jgi:hypothetical protein
VSDFNDVEELLRIVRGGSAQRPSYVFRKVGAHLFEVGELERPRYLSQRADSEGIEYLHRVVSAAGRQEPLQGRAREACRAKLRRAAFAVQRRCKPLGDALLDGLHVSIGAAWFAQTGEAMPVRILTM